MTHLHLTPQEERRATAFLQKRGIALADIESFRFMERHTPSPHRHSADNLYGPGILTLCLRDGSSRTFITHQRHHRAALIRTLVTHDIPFTNLKSRTQVLAEVASETTADSTTQPTGQKRYSRPSLYLFWYLILFFVSFILGFYFASQSEWYAIGLCIPFFAASVYLIYLLQTRFCYLLLDDKTFTVQTTGNGMRFHYDRVLKVNIDFAREQTFTHVMEVLYADYRYRLFYIGRTPRRKLSEIVHRLRAEGIDATLSLNPDKSHYEDVYHQN